MAKDFVSQHVVDGYDEHIRKLIPAYDLLHQHIQAILSTNFSQENIRVLIIGCGTGYELGYLLKRFPTWKFVVSDLSSTMLDKAKANVHLWQSDHRVEFILGDFAEYYKESTFDIVLTILVSHFIPYDSKASFFQSIGQVLKLNAMLISFDLMRFETVAEALQLKEICLYNGLSEKQAQAMLDRLELDFYPLSEAETIQYFQKAKLFNIKQFIQVASYRGFYAIKN